MFRGPYLLLHAVLVNVLAIFIFIHTEFLPTAYLPYSFSSLVVFVSRRCSMKLVYIFDLEM